MSEWIDFSVYAAMTAGFWFAFVGWSSAVTLQMVADRNEEWLTANREWTTTLLRGRWLVGSSWFLWSCHAWGAISLAILLACQLGAWPQSWSMGTNSRQWEVLKDAHSTLLIVGLLYYLGVVVISMRRMQKDVPLAERRQASLRPRTIDDFAPRWLSMGSYLLIAVHLTAWVVVGALGLYSTPGFWTRFAGPVAFSAIFLVVAHATVNRRISDFFAFHDRRQGVRFAFASLIYAQIMFALRLYGDVAGPSFETDRATHLVLQLAMVLAMVALALISNNGTTYPADASRTSLSRP
jgi:hypothetical protein